MPAPTALKGADAPAVPQSVPQNVQGDAAADVPMEEPANDDIVINVTTTVPLDDEMTDGKESGELAVDEEGRPVFSGENARSQTVAVERRAIAVPPHRFTPLKNAWTKVYYPLVDHLKLQVKMDLRRKRVLLRTSRETRDRSAIQKGDDFLRAFMLGFDVDDATALLRLDDLYIETFEIRDIKALQGDHLSRTIGRIAGKDGKTKFAIENASRTRVVLADSKIHILGGYKNIKIARQAVVKLILGKPPSKVYGNLRVVSSRMKERF